MSKDPYKHKEEALESNPKSIELKKINKISILVLLILLLGSGWFAYLHHKTQSLVNNNDLVFMILPEILVNIRSHKSNEHILKVIFIMQIYKKNNTEEIKNAYPIIMDQLLSYLRELTINDLEGSGLERVKQALLERINTILSPIKIQKLMVKEFIIQ